MKKPPPLPAKPNHYAPAPRMPMKPKAAGKFNPAQNLGKYHHKPKS